MLFTKKNPCNNCPYRIDAPLRYWSIEEFKDLMQNEKSQFGVVYGCHKKDGNVCVGWLMKQDENGLPSISLRMALSKQNITGEYLDSLSCKSKLYENVEEMIEANYPELIN